MKPGHFLIFRRMTMLVFTLTTVLGVLFMGITYLASMHFYQASTQLLNKAVAGHIATFTSPYGNGGFDKQKADSVFQNAMILSPSAEVYFLDTTGRVVYFHASPADIKLWVLPMESITRYIAGKGNEYVKGPDPRDPGNPKIFSAAAVSGSTGKLGYIYVILGSQEYRNVSQMLYGSHIGNLIIEAFCFIIVVSLLISLFYVRGIERRFNAMIGVLARFQQGDFEARFALSGNDDLAPITRSFNKMADLLVYNINRLTHSEKERKDFMANISHDLRTPLAIARGYSETLLFKRQGNDLSPREQEEYIQLVVSKLQQVEHMVGQLFELSKMESAAFTPHKEPFVFSEILHEIIHTSSLNAEKRKLHMDFSQSSVTAWIVADIRMMERVIQNLLDNAITYTSEAGKIQISLVQEAGDWVFRIENQGAPLDPDLLEWLNSVEPASQNMPRPNRAAIGLSIVKKILSLHQFTLKVIHLSSDAAEGGWNVFTIRMPLYKADQRIAD